VGIRSTLFGTRRFF